MDMDGFNVLLEDCLEISRKFHEIQEKNADLALALIPTLIDQFAEENELDAIELAKNIAKLVESNHRDNPDLYK